MKFAWEGFSLEHPDEWAPVTITGDRKEGYVRIASVGRLAYQVRWKHTAAPSDLEPNLKRYLDRLHRDTRKTKKAFEAHWETEDSVLTYSYSGQAFGRGAAFFDTRTERTFFLEVVSTKNDRLAKPYREAFDSFHSGGEEWAVLGLSVRLPKIATVERKSFLAGKTELRLAAKGAVIEAQRWGFGEQLVERHGLESWAKAAMGMKGAEIVEHDLGVELIQKTRLKPAVYALVRRQPDLNQLTTLKVTSRHALWRPTWDWLM